MAEWKDVRLSSPSIKRFLGLVYGRIEAERVKSWTMAGHVLLIDGPSLKRQHEKWRTPIPFLLVPTLLTSSQH